MPYSDAFNIKTTNVSFNSVADAIDGALSRAAGGTTTGTSTAYACSASPAWTSYDSGSIITITPHTTNTGATTLNVNGLGARNVNYMGNALIGGELVSGQTATLVNNGTTLTLLNHGGGWTTYTPTFTATSPMTIASTQIANGRWQRHGKTVRLSIEGSCTTGGSATSELYLSLPSGISSQNAFYTPAYLRVSNNFSQGMAFFTGTQLVLYREPFYTAWPIGAQQGIWTQVLTFECV